HRGRASTGVAGAVPKGWRHGKSQRVDSHHRRHATRSGDKSAASQPVSEPPGPSYGEKGLSDGALRGRLCGLCAKRVGGTGSLGRDSGVGPETGLRLHPAKTRIVNAAERGGFDFLGYHFEQYRQGGGKKWP